VENQEVSRIGMVRRPAYMYYSGSRLAVGFLLLLDLWGRPPPLPVIPPVDEALLNPSTVRQVADAMTYEIFKEFYPETTHGISATYLFVGLKGHHALVPWIWTVIVLNLAALFLFMLPASRSLKWLNVACVLAIIGIWIEKGMGLVIPAFVPTQLGEIVEYQPTLNETRVCVGIWAFGFLLYSMFVKMTVPVLDGRLRAD